MPAPLRRFIDWVAGYTLAAPGEVLAMALRVNALTAPVAPPGWQRAVHPPDVRLTPARRRIKPRGHWLQPRFRNRGPERLYNQVWLRKTFLIVVLIVLWELYARHLDNPLLVPTFTDTITAWWEGITSGVLPERAWASLQVLAIGFSTGCRAGVHPDGVGDHHTDRHRFLGDHDSDV